MTEGEREGIIESIQRLLGNKSPLAVCAYGSRVAGYAKLHSDYDAIVVLEKYSPKVRYEYITTEPEISTIIVDSKSLLQDAEKAYLGEFVVGRFLNPHDPLIGREYLETIDLTYKKRVILEGLQDAVNSYGRIMTEILIPLEYFLFEKLKKRAAVYPPALYSYVKTYSGSLRDINIQSSKAGFRRAAEELSSDDAIYFESDMVIPKNLTNHVQTAKFYSFVTQTARSVTQYAVHGYAGRVGLNVTRKELFSKIARSREVESTPIDLKQPKRLWKIREGSLIVEGEDWLRQVAFELGFGRSVKLFNQQVGKFYSTSNKYLLEDGFRKMHIVIKKFGDISSMKWTFLNVWALASKRFDNDPLSRMYREYAFHRMLREKGFNTPRILSIVLNDRIIVKEFVQGDSLEEIVSRVLELHDEDISPISIYGQELARVHALGISIGDTKPSNTIFSDGKIIFIDLEQAEIEGDRMWDLAEFVYFSTKLTLNARSARMIVRAFAEGYLKEGDADVVKKSLNLKYLAPFQPILAPNVTRAVRKEIRAVTK